MFVIWFFFSLLIGAPHLDVPAANERNTGGIYKCNALSPRLNDCELLLQSEYSKSTKYMNQSELGPVPFYLIHTLFATVMLLFL